MVPPDRSPTAGPGNERRGRGQRRSLASWRSDRGAPDAENGPRYETGTTVVGLRAVNGVVLGADRRMSLGGSLTTSKNGQKIEQVHPTAAMAFSGVVGSAQDLLQQLRAEARLYRTRRGEPMSMTALSQVAGHLLRGHRVMPLLGGVDEAGSHVFEIDGGGGVIEDSYAASGSGMQLAYGVLEQRYDPDATIDEATTVATDAVEAASERDNASGDGVTIATVTADGVAIDSRGAS